MSAASPRPAAYAGQYLWLLALFSALVLRRLEPPEADPGTAERDDLPG
jgi:hypothetical protein